MPQNMIYGLAFWSTRFLAQFFILMSTFRSTIKRNVRDMKQFYEYMKYKELSRSIQQRVSRYYEYFQKNVEGDGMIRSQVSPNLRGDLLLITYKRMIARVNLLNQLPEPILVQVMSLVTSEIYLPDDVIVKYGSPGDTLYYIACGTVSVLKENGEQIRKLKKGSSFGAASLVIENEKIFVNIVALELSELWVLRRSDFLAILTPHANLLNRLQHLALTILHKSPKSL